MSGRAQPRQKDLEGKPPYRVHYNRRDVEDLLLIGRVVSMGGVGKVIHEKSTRTALRLQTAWAKERAALVRSNPGWFVAYHEGERVALEPSLDRLIATLNAELGVPRKPCEIHEVTEHPRQWRGPGPRLMPRSRPVI